MLYIVPREPDMSPEGRLATERLKLEALRAQTRHTTGYERRMMIRAMAECSHRISELQAQLRDARLSASHED